MTEWKEYKLGEIASFVTEKVSVQDVKLEDYISTENMLPDKGGITIASNKPQEGSATKYFNDTILISNIRPYFKKIWYTDKVGGCSNDVLCFKAKDELVFSKYLYFLLSQDTFFDYVMLGSKGCKMPRGDKSHIMNWEISIPPLPTQRRIASILSSLDDKIDLLHRENATLEQMAETLFRQWFVVERKEEWEEVLITELFEVKDGTHDSPKPQEYGHKLITSKYIHNNSIDLNGAYNISDTDFTNINKRSKVDTNDILFSMIGTIGLIYLEQNEIIDYAIKNVGLIKTSQNSNWKYFIYLWFKSELGLEWIHENKTGSTQEYISLNSLRSIKFRIKDLKQVQEFDQTVNIYFEKLRTNKQQIRTLIQTRDGLLPRLMGGEVKIL